MEKYKRNFDVVFNLLGPYFSIQQQEI